MASRGWANLYHANYYFLVLGGLLYLTLLWWRRGIFILQAAIDFILGLLIYNGLYYLSAYLLIHGRVNPWTSLVPGFVLMAYGLTLRRGRQIWSLLEL